MLTVARLAGLLVATEPRLGRTRLIAVDGRSGAGKTWLAEVLAAPLGAPVIHMDDLYPGWDGLTEAAGPLAEWVIDPLSKGEPARWRRFDWDTMSYAEWHTAPPADVVVVEGCGSVRSALDAAYAARIWVDAPAAARRERLRARPDWAAYEPFARRWAAQEDQLYRTEHTRRHCDVIVENPRPATHGDPSLRVRLRGRGLYRPDGACFIRSAGPGRSGTGPRPRPGSPPGRWPRPGPRRPVPPVRRPAPLAPPPSRG